MIRFTITFEYFNLTIELYYRYKRKVREMGNIIKINMYVEMKMKKNNQLKLKTVEEAILEYNDWIKKTNREDKIENYEEFLRAQ
jgi:hypothetical protein